MARFPYQFFDEYVVRTPIFSRKNFQQAVSHKDEITNTQLKEICANPIFQEAIYLASPNLHDELIKWIDSEKEFSEKEHQKLKHTIVKYYSRISTRCTPFGLFSAVGLGRFSLGNSNILNNEAGHCQLSSNDLLRGTKLDMYFLVSLAQYFVQRPDIRKKLLFYPNNSIYKVGSRIRYIEYQYVGGKREYIISLAPISKELQQILDFSKHGKTIGDIAGIMINNEITNNEAAEFVEELIDNQVLISELDPNVSGQDFLDEIISVLDNIGAKNEAEILISIKYKLNELDQNIGNPISKYIEIEKFIKSFAIEYQPKYLFQTDLYKKDLFDLSFEWKKQLKKAIGFLNKITLDQKENEFSKFKKAFSERFETEEVPLLYVLDNEVGIGYKQNVSAQGIHPYLEDLIFPASQKNQNKNIELNSVHQILNEKVQEALMDNQYSIELCDEDFKDLKRNGMICPIRFP